MRSPEPLDDVREPWLVARARRDPDAAALRFAGEVLTFAALAARADLVARRLAALGVSARDRVAVLLESSPRFVEVVHAVQRLGATLVPLNVRLTVGETAALLADAPPRLVLCDAPFAERVGTGAAPRVEARRELDAFEPAGGLPTVTPGPGSVHSILFTSGTSGRPKGAMLTHANHLASAAASRKNLGVRPDDRWLLAMPLHHVGGLSILLRSVIDGIPVELHPGFDVAAVDRALHDDGVTLLSLVPTMLHRLLDAGRPPWPRLRAVLLGGGPAPEALVVRAVDAGVPVLPTYGLTEAASQVATMPAGEALLRPGSSGRALPGTEIQIADPDRTGTGEILVRGATVMAGYFSRPEATEATLRDGWLHTGDLGRLDEEGFLFVADRRSDLIVSGGENVYPAEVEAVLLAHPDVAEAAVYPLPDPEWGQRVAAAIVRREGAASDAAALEAWCAARLGRFKLPRTIRFLPELPKTASGKIQRRRLAATADAAQSS